MSIFKTLARTLPTDTKALTLPPVLQSQSNFMRFGTEAVLYPTDTGETYINKGYKKNAIVYAIVSKCAKEFGQVAWYHYKIKNSERKTWAEYVELTSKDLSQKAMNEARKMRVKSIDQSIVDSPLSKFLAKPNRNQSRAQFLEQLYGFKLLTGEANQWLSRGLDGEGRQITKGKPYELHIIPKGNLLLHRGRDIWDIGSYEILIETQRLPTPAENMIMWKFPNYESPNALLTHLRGMAPLEAGLLLLQAGNEGAERLININKNQGAAGIASNELLNPRDLSPEQTLMLRQQFDNVVNNNANAGKIAALSGKWSYMQFGMDVGQLQLLEQVDNVNEWLCNIFDFPPGLLTKNQTHENQKEQKRDFIYSNIATACYSLRDEWNSKLLPTFDLDRDSHVIDCIPQDLPELQQDLKEQVAALKDAWWLSPDEKRIESGYDALGTQEAQRIFIPGGLKTIEDVTDGLGSDFDNEQRLLDA